MLRCLKGLFLLSIVPFMVLGLSYGQPGNETTVIYGQSISITDLDPAYGAYLNYPAGYEAAYVIYDGLVTFDKDLNIVPALAVDWEISDDKLSWTFHLRRGVKFHDGTPFDAEAVKVNFIRGMDPERTTTNRPQWDPWESIEVIDRYTVRAKTKEPFAFALNALAHGAGHMVSPAAIEKYNDHPEHHPVGTGPFMLESFRVGEELTLVANREYWGGSPKVDKLIFRYISDASTRVAALLTGEVDVIDAVPPPQALRLQGEPEVNVIVVPGLRPYQINLNLMRDFFKDKKVRQALNYAISKEAIAKGIFLDFAKPADSPLAFNTTGYASVDVYEYDPQRAKELLAEAGWTDSDGDGILDKDGQPFEVTLITPDGWLPQDVAISEAVANQLGEVGIKVIINKVEKAAFWGPITAPAAQVDWDMAFFGFNPSNASGQYHLENLYFSNPDPAGSPRAWNMMRYENPEVDQLILEAKREFDPERRAELMAEAQRIIWEDAPAIWLVVPEIISAARKGVTGVEVWPTVFTILRNVEKHD